MGSQQKEGSKGKSLKRRLGTASVFAICTGAMFSSGFFLLPGLAAEESGPSLPLVYVLASLLILPAIFSIAELSAAIPRAGGPYLFLSRSLGSLMGIIAAFGKYLQLLLKGAFAFVGVGAYLTLVLDVSIQPVAIALIIVFTILNLLNVQQTARTEIILVGILLLLLTYFIASGILELNTDNTNLREEFQPLLPFGIEGLFAGVALIFVSYGGVGQIASLAEEIQEPARSIPRGMLIGLGVSTVFYFIGTTIMVGLLSSEALHTDQSPVATTAKAFTQLPLPVMIVVAAALAAFASTGNAAILSAARYPLALARDKLIWKKFGHLDDNGVPKISVLATGLILILLVLAFDVKGIAKLASAFLLFVFLGMCLAVIIFRESRIREYQPGYKSPLYPWMQIFGIIIYIALIVGSGLKAVGLLLGLCILCFLWYRFGIHEKKEPTAAVYSLFARIAGKRQQSNTIGETGLPMLGGLELAQLAERAIVFDLEEKTSLEKVIRRAADALVKHLGGERQEMVDHLQQEVSHWKSPLRSNILLTPALLQGIEQAEMVIIRGNISLNDHSVSGLIVLVDDENSSGRLMKLLAQLEAVIFHSDFSRQWKEAENSGELKKALKRDVRSVRSITVQIESSAPTSELIGRSFDEARLPDESLAVLILRQNESIIPKGSTEIREGDEITFLAKDKSLDELKKWLNFQNNKKEKS